MTLGRAGIWALNGALFVLCCFLAASIVNALIGAWLSDAPLAAEAGPTLAAPVQRSWDERKVILEKNLFKVSTLIPENVVEQAPPETEDLEATKLPLKLLGTVASTEPKDAWAAVEDQKNREDMIVRVDDKLLDEARVVRIERRRIVLQNGPRREELALEDQELPLPGRASRPRALPRRQAAVRAPAEREASPRTEALRDRVRQLSESRFQVDRQDLDQAVRNPAELFSQARILPKYEDGQMVGVQLNSIKPGSLFEAIGIQDGDTITEVNGIVVSSPQDSATLLRELTESDAFEVSVLGNDGEPRVLSYEVQGD